MIELIPLAGMLTGTVITLALVFGFVKLIQGPLGQALARRIQGRTGEGDRELRGDVAELRDELDLMRRQLDETQERIDFAERLLAQAGPGERLTGGG